MGEEGGWCRGAFGELRGFGGLGNSGFGEFRAWWGLVAFRVERFKV